MQQEAVEVGMVPWTPKQYQANCLAIEAMDKYHIEKVWPSVIQ
jgi:hypothetical protein